MAREGQGGLRVGPLAPDTSGRDLWEGLGSLKHLVFGWLAFGLLNLKLVFDIPALSMLEQSATNKIKTSTINLQADGLYCPYLEWYLAHHFSISESSIRFITPSWRASHVVLATSSTMTAA